MKQRFQQIQKHSLNLTPALLKQIKILSLTGHELRKELNELIEKVLEEEEDKVIKYFKDQILLDNYLKFVNPKRKNQIENLDIPNVENLKDILSEQFFLLNLEDFQYLIGEYLIDSIQEDGRLHHGIDFEDIKVLILEKFNLTINNEEIEYVLKEIQKLEPVGCGYREITESLLVQITQLEIPKDEKKKIGKIVEDLAKSKTTLDDLNTRYKTIIRGLSFNPGFAVHSKEVLYIEPDVFALRGTEKWQVALNDSFMPQELMDRIKNETKDSTSEYKNQAKSLIKGIERRQKTLLSIAEYLVTKQSKYLDGNEKLTPINLAEISKFLKLSESTVSRIVNSNYLQLPSKLLLLKGLLERKVNGRSGGKNISSNGLIVLIKKTIKQEDKIRPLSDEKIKEILLKKYSINLSRRTICKYRKKANIGSVRQRNKIELVSL